jgi:hypothetical protein
MALSLTVENNGDGTGTYEVAGSTGTTLIYHMPYGEDEWSLHDTIVGDQIGEIDAEVGLFWWYAVDDAGIPTKPIRRRITNGSGDPILEQITEEIAVRLEIITTGNDYLLNVPSVNRPTRSGTPGERDGEIILEQGPATKNDALSFAGNPYAVAYDQVFNILCYVSPTKSETRSIDEIGNLYAAEIVRGLGDYPRWESFDNLAVSASIPSHSIESSGDGGPSTVNLTLVVTYRVSETDFYTQR